MGLFCIGDAMAKQYALDGVNEVLELGKDGHKIDGSNGFIELTDNAGTRINVRAAAGVNSHDLVTKQQLDQATGIDSGHIVLEYSANHPTVDGFTANETKEFDLTGGTATAVAKYLKVPSSTDSYDEVDDKTYIIDVTNGLLIPNNQDKQHHTWVFELFYDRKGGTINDEDISVVFKLVEYNGTEVDEMWIEQMCGFGNGREGYINVTFNVISSSDTRGTGKGWRFKVMSKEADGNFRFRLDKITRISH